MTCKTNIIKEEGIDMREIKFRAWFRNECEMKDVAINNIYKGNNTFLYLSPLPISDYKPVDLMQYTGLKDCNGKEIYEGDIIKYIDASNKVNHLVVKWNESNACFDIGWVRTDYASNSGEVIGNIHENPELLEK